MRGKSFQSFEGPECFGTGWTEKEMPPLAADLFAVPGITKVSFSRYTVHLVKGKVFCWDTMLESILPILKQHLSPEDEMVEEACVSSNIPRARSIDMDLDPFDDDELSVTEPVDETEPTEVGEPETTIDSEPSGETPETVDETVAESDEA
jgi:hypothetical protein